MNQVDPARAEMEAVLDDDDIIVNPKKSGKKRHGTSRVSLSMDDREQTSVLSLRLENSFFEKLKATQAALYAEKGKLYTLSKIAGTIIKDHYRD